MSHNTTMIGVIIGDLMRLRERMQEEERIERENLSIYKYVKAQPKTDPEPAEPEPKAETEPATAQAPALLVEPTQQSRHWYAVQDGQPGTHVFNDGPTRQKWIMEDTKARRVVKKDKVRLPLHQDH